MKTSTSVRPEIANFYFNKGHLSHASVRGVVEASVCKSVSTEIPFFGFASLFVGEWLKSCSTFTSRIESEPYPFTITRDDVVRPCDTTPASGEVSLRRAIWGLSLQGVTAQGRPTPVQAWQGFDRYQVGLTRLNASALSRVYTAARDRLRRLAPAGEASQVPEVANPVSPAVAAHLAYLDRMADRAVVSRQLADFARVVWHAVEVATDNALAVPAASAFEGGPIRYTWRHAGQWLTVAISEGGLCEWTYLNSITDELWGEDSTAGDLSPTELKGYLIRLVG